MEVVATLKANDCKTGVLLSKVRAVFGCEECISIDEFRKEHGEGIMEFLKTRLSPVVLAGDYVLRMDLMELAEEPAGVSYD